ncbi:MAG TPA: hypothetical protein VE487_06205, partial [Ilumatobacter sp.]|nr:hypothetical protein [Ilumatobacter sp.]
MQQQVEVVRHEAIRMHLDRNALRALGKQTFESKPVVDGEEDALAVGTAIHDVVPGARNVVSCRPSHALILNARCHTARCQ